MHNPVFDGLIKHRESLVAEVRRAGSMIQRLLGDLEHLDATIQQFNPAHKAVSPAVNPIGSGNRITRVLLTILRKSAEPMTLRAITIALMDNVGLERKDRKRVNRMREQCRTALERQRINGTVVKEAGPDRALVWRIK